MIFVQSFQNVFLFAMIVSWSEPREPYDYGRSDEEKVEEEVQPMDTSEDEGNVLGDKRDFPAVSSYFQYNFNDRNFYNVRKSWLLERCAFDT